MPIGISLFCKFRRSLWVLILMAWPFLGCVHEENQKLYTFHAGGNAEPTFLGPWRYREPVSFQMNGDTVSFAVTSVLSNPEVIDRPYPLIRMPWVKLGNVVTERAWSHLALAGDSLVLEMNAQSRRLSITGLGLSLQVPMDSLWIQFPPGQPGKTRWVLRRRPACSPQGICLQGLEFSRERGLESLEVTNTPAGPFILKQP